MFKNLEFISYFNLKNVEGSTLLLFSIIFNI